MTTRAHSGTKREGANLRLERRFRSLPTGIYASAVGHRRQSQMHTRSIKFSVRHSLPKPSIHTRPYSFRAVHNRALPNAAECAPAVTGTQNALAWLIFNANV